MLRACRTYACTHCMAWYEATEGQIAPMKERLLDILLSGTNY